MKIPRHIFSLMSARPRFVGGPRTPCAGDAARSAASTLFQPLENPTLAFSKDWKISRKNFQASELFAPLFPSLGKTTASRFQGLETGLRVVGFLFLLFTCGCVSIRTPEQQSAERYKAIMQKWRGEINNEAVTFHFKNGELTKELQKQFSQTTMDKMWQLMPQHYRDFGEINGRYAELLTAERPASSFQFPFAKTCEMFNISRDMGIECARMWERSDYLQAEAIEQKTDKLIRECVRELKKWFVAHNVKELCNCFECEGLRLKFKIQSGPEVNSPPKLEK
jgi:hypothetical protein